MLDPYQRMNEANSRLEIERSIGGEINSIVDLLRFYGIEFSENGVVGDFENAANVQTSNGRNFAYPYWLRIPETNLMTEEPVVANLNELLFAETGHFSGREKSNFLKPIVIQASRFPFKEGCLVVRAQRNWHSALMAQSRHRKLL